MSGGARGAAVRVGIDIGGTFTDIVLDRGDGHLHVRKVSSTTHRPEAAVVDGLAALLDECGVAGGEVSEVIHGTTVASNTILQKVGARTGLVTTRGFRDVLEIGRIRTPDLYDLKWRKPPPLVPRRHRLEVAERMDAGGNVVVPLDEAAVVAAADALVAAGIESVAIVFINSYANPAHEEAAERLVRARHPALDVSASWRVLPEKKEYERTSTTVVNAYLRPVMREYLERLESGLGEIGVAAPLLVIASNGGVASARATAERPAFSVGSGPAAGVSGAARLGRVSGRPDLIALDMGGTTAKASLVEGGKPALTTEYEFREGISVSSRFVKAGGYMMKVPAIDIAEVGAGGGSIADVDAGGLLRVGPASAGADPGPACYGAGGERPTVTDASVALGYLNPEHLAGGALRIHRDRALAAIESAVARPLGIDVIEAAHGIRDVANASMARALRSVTVERGRDPREFALMVFGGSAALHAADLARTLEVREVIVPELPGVFTAVGMLASDVEHHFVRACSGPLGGLAGGSAGAVLDGLRDETRDTLAAEGFGPDESRVEFMADLRYPRQSLELTVPLTGYPVTGAVIEALVRDFVRAYETIYGYAPERETPELVNLRAVGKGLRAGRLEFGGHRVEEPAAAEHADRRDVHFRRGEPPLSTPIRDRASIGSEPEAGPLVVESYESTVVVPPGARIRRGEAGNLVIEPGRSEPS